MSPQKKLAILWLRNDLRLHDHDGWHIAQEYAQVLPVFVWNSAWDEIQPLGFARCGEKRKQWILASAAELRKKLQSMGSDLHFMEGNPLECIFSLLKDFPQAEVIAGFEPAWEERQEIENLQKQGVSVRRWYGSTLLHPEDLPFSPKETPAVFTAFRGKIEKNPAFRIRRSFPAPDRLPPPPNGFVCKPFEGIDEVKGPFGLSPGEDAALARIQSYIHESKQVAVYKETRNGLLGVDYSGKWSVWMACGALSPRMIYHEVKRFEAENGANESTYWVFFELLWRDFFKFVSWQQGSRMFARGGLKGAPLPAQATDAAFRKWSEAQTGQSFCDANMRELLETGFMSNRGRQNAASYWCHDLKGDWRTGAAWFEHLLLDYDPDSNYGNWLYIAGLGNDPRQGRKFNLEKQANDYDPERKYIHTWLK